MENEIIQALSQKLDALRQLFSELSLQLDQCATDLRNDGSPPSETLLKGLEAARSTFEEIRAAVLERGQPANVPLGEMKSLNELSSAISILHDAQRKRIELGRVRDRALAILEKVLQLTHKDDVNFSPLQECHSTALGFMRAADESDATEFDPELQSLAEGGHPFSNLVTLVESGHCLADDEWERMTNAVAERFGRPLSIAAVRGKLTFKQKSDSGIELATSPEHSRPLEVSVDEPSNAVVSVGIAETEVHEFLPEQSLPASSSIDDRATGSGNQALKVSGDIKVLAPEVSSQPKDSSTQTQMVEERPTSTKSLVENNRNLTEAVGPALEDLDFSNEDSAQTIAQAILNDPANGETRALEILTWRLIFEDRLGLAFHLAQCIEELYPEVQPHLPSWLIRAAALGLSVRHPNREIAAALKQDFANFGDGCFPPERWDWNHAVRFFLASCTLRAALLAPGTGASLVLHSLRMKEKLSSLFQYCQIVASYGDKLQPLDPSALKRVKDQADWLSELQDLQSQVEAWCSQAPRFTMVYAVATKVWRRWQEPGGLIHSLLLPVRRNDPTRLEGAKRDLDRFSDEAEVRQEIHHTDRKVLCRRTGTDITAKALGQILKHVREAVDFVRRWINLQETTPGHNKGYLQKQAEGLREQIFAKHPAVLEELDGFESSSNSFLVRVGIKRCRLALENVFTLFDPEGPSPSNEQFVTDLLHADLLRIPSVSFDAEWTPHSPHTGLILHSILDLVAFDRFDWKTAFERHHEERDHEATEKVLEYLARTGNNDLDISEMSARREEAIRECRIALRRDVDATRKEVEGAVHYGLLKEKERLDYAAELEQVEKSIQEVLFFRKVHEKLSDIRKKIESRRVGEVEGVRKRLDASMISKDHPDYMRIHALLEKGDIHTANEYIHLVSQNLSLPDAESQPQRFRTFFPGMFREISDFLEENKGKISKVVNDVRSFSKGHRQTYKIGPVDMYRVAGNQALQAADMLEVWFSAKKTQRMDEDGARIILNNLGFNTLKLSVTRPGRRTWLDLRTEPLRDRNRCPVPFYGSNANGRYRILCVWDRPTEEDLVNDLGETSHGVPALVFHFGRMTEQRRRDLSRLCRERRRTFVVLDDVFLLYLCGERGSRLPILFECALPFTFFEPYTTTAGLVPPEMFYGRSRERDSIFDPNGTCFIYGGRQLGKTALLRDVERTFHNPERGKVALWIDLKTHGIGYDRSVDELWLLLGSEFKRLGVIPASMPAHAGVDTILNHVQKWLQEDERRRILLLLDEADRFLEVDGRKTKDEKQEKGEFVRSDRLKGLMERTNRRFKVVLAGLHNVARTTRLENHPLAHFGEPTCIGPLLNDGESREARALVEQPLATLGYFFDSPDLVMRIVSQTNYYPSLIQLYCNQLLRHVAQPQPVTFDPKTSPPFLITSRQIEEAYKSQELRKAIRDRFMWTLDLDPRYRVIALSIALRSGAPWDSDEGLSIPWVRDQALTFWRSGFQDVVTEDSFRVLLDEMVGLGVLRTVADGRYALRSPSVATLIGTEEEIELELAGAEGRLEVPPPYEATKFRTAFRSDRSKRSPLTAQQESDLRSKQNGVCVVFGCEAAGIKDLQAFLKSAYSDCLFEVDRALDSASFRKWLAEFEPQDKDSVSLILVPSIAPWNDYWIREANECLHTHRPRSRFVRVIFLADEKTAWQLLSAETAGELTAESFASFSLGPWHDAALHQWLDDCGFPSDRQSRERMRAVTGNWPSLLQRFYERARLDVPKAGQILAQLEDLLDTKTCILEVGREFGMDGSAVRRVLRDLTIVESATIEELSAIVDDIPPGIVSETIRWADRLSLVRPEGNGRWCVDPVVGKIAKAITE